MKGLVRKYLKKRNLEIINSDALKELRKKKEFSDYIQNQKYLEKDEFRYILWLDRVYQKIIKIPGHVLELGVAYGRNSILFGHQIKMNGDELVRKYHGFDTFDGYSEESLKSDKNLSDSAWKNNSKEWVQDKIGRVGLTDICSLHQGDILKTVPEFIQKNNGLRVALLYVDCNAYEPALKGMEYILPYMTPGGIICIDEKKQGGETKALIEFCEKNGLVFQKDAGPFAIPAYTVIGK
ncbi:MAG: class I SAM-dependent methyltransferase [Flavobacteriales bacterium]